MQHLIKRQTGPHASKTDQEGMTLAERLAANRKASQEVVRDAEDLMEEALEIETPEDVLELTELAPAESATGTEAIIEAAKAARDGQVKKGSSGKTCLVVDDSRVIRKVASSIVSGLGYTVIEAENGEEALTRCQHAMPDVVLTDWDMPVMDGPAFVSSMRQLPGASDVKVVFCTSKGEAEDIHKAIGSGADDYIVKPFDDTMLTNKLQKLGVI